VNALVCLAALASAPPTTIIRAADQLDYVLLADARPVILRLHLRLGDRPYHAAFDDWTARLFKWFDRDKDGYLSKAEAARLLPADWMRTLTQGAIRNDRPPAVPFATLDTNKDGKVSLAEFRAYMRRTFRPLLVQMQAENAGRARRINDSLWKRLDADGDGRLSEAELAKLPGLLAKLDENEDEMLSESELLNEAEDVYGFGFPRGGGGKPGQPPFYVSLADSSPAAVAAALIRQYDRDRDGKLSIKEIGLPEAEFKALDLDGDGKLDSRELERFVLRTPDLTLRCGVGTQPGAAGLFGSLGLGPQRVALMTKMGTGLTRGFSRQSADAVALTVKGTRVEVTAAQGAMFGRNFGVGNFYLQQFQTELEKLPGKPKGLTREQAEGSPYVAALFTAADRNADGLLERKELADFFEVVSAGGAATVSLVVDDGGRSLFAAIDADNNKFLTIREMRGAWKRVAPLCKDGKALAREDLPRTVRIQLFEGDASQGRFARAVFVGGTATPVRLTVSVPAWFTKMDRNGDGDVSRAEWLGTEEDFKKIDLDGDGLISPEEARKAKFDPTKKE
jgi:Ca2+-binding EF-hand superfamily protein